MKVDPLWQQRMLSEYVIEVCYSLGMAISLNRRISEAFLRGLQEQCVTYSCLLSINSQLKPTGVATVTLRTTLPHTVVSASIAKAKRNSLDFTAVVVNAPLPKTMNINAAMQTRWNWRVSNG